MAFEKQNLKKLKSNYLRFKKRIEKVEFDFDLFKPAL